MNIILQPAISGLLFCTLLACSPAQDNVPSTVAATAQQFELVISQGRVIDPASDTDELLNVGISGGQILALSAESLQGDRVINAEGLIVAPGFIDLHAHGQTDEAYRLMVRDGVTSAFELEIGAANVADWYRQRAGGQVVNYGVSVGHIPVRMEMYNDEGTFLPTGAGGSATATAEQITTMANNLQRGLDAGAVAVGFGLAYTPGATQQEFETMMQVVGDNNTSAHIHTRGGVDGLRSIVATAAKYNAALHVVHANSSGGSSINEFLGIVQLAQDNGQDVTTEMYPYEASYSDIGSALFDNWESWDDEQFARQQWVETGERLTRESFAAYRTQGGPMITFSRTEEMTLAALTHPLTMIASDGRVINGKGHPRTTGSYAKVLGKYVRQENALTLMQALKKMTIEPARRLENFVPVMAKKGRLEVGADADITVFDPDTVIDRATYVDPTIPSEGIEFVLVNGQIVVDGGELLSDSRPGLGIKSN